MGQTQSGPDMTQYYKKSEIPASFGANNATAFRGNVDAPSYSVAGAPFVPSEYLRKNEVPATFAGNDSTFRGRVTAQSLTLGGAPFVPTEYLRKTEVPATFTGDDSTFRGRVTAQSLTLGGAPFVPTEYLRKTEVPATFTGNNAKFNGAVEATSFTINGQAIGATGPQGPEGKVGLQGPEGKIGLQGPQGFSVTSITTSGGNAIFTTNAPTNNTTTIPLPRGVGIANVINTTIPSTTSGVPPTPGVEVQLTDGTRRQFALPVGPPGPQGFSVTGITASGGNAIFTTDAPTNNRTTIPLPVGPRGFGVTGITASGGNAIFTTDAPTNNTTTIPLPVGPQGPRGFSVTGITASGGNAIITTDAPTNNTTTIPLPVGPTGVGITNITFNATTGAITIRTSDNKDWVSTANQTTTQLQEAMRTIVRANGMWCANGVCQVPANNNIIKFGQTHFNQNGGDTWIRMLNHTTGNTLSTDYNAGLAASGLWARDEIYLNNHKGAINLAFELREPIREKSAGQIAYQKFSNDLDIVGAGATGQTRNVRIWDNLNVASVTIGGWQIFEENQHLVFRRGNAAGAPTNDQPLIRFAQDGNLWLSRSTGPGWVADNIGDLRANTVKYNDEFRLRSKTSNWFLRDNGNWQDPLRLNDESVMRVQRS